MALSDNKTGLQEILAAVNALPEAGSGGGGSGGTALLEIIADGTLRESVELEVGKMHDHVFNGGAGYAILTATVVDWPGTIREYPLLFSRKEGLTNWESPSLGNRQYGLRFVMPSDGITLSFTLD